MPRYAARADENQPDIVKALRLAGAVVQHLHAVGAGCPDLLVGFGGRNYLLEVKDPSKPPSRRALTPDQVTWHGLWRGQVSVVHTPQEAIAVITGR